MEHIVFSEEHCVMCGAVIPEGRQVCMECERRVMQDTKAEGKGDGRISGRRKRKAGTDRNKEKEL